MGETRFDQSPARGVVGIAVRQSPYRVKMIGQNDDRLDREGMMRLDVTNGRFQRVDMIR